jgi:CheY-like chemotaxis protein
MVISVSACHRIV